MAHACPTREYMADAHPVQLQRLQNRGPSAIGNLGRCTQVREFHVAFKIPYVHDYITKLCRTQIEVTLNLTNLSVRGIGQEVVHRKYKRLKLVGGESCDLTPD
jgi:hypothetical protein